MQHERVIALDEWFPARRRRSRQKELGQRHDPLCAERRRVETAAEADSTRSRRRHDPCEARRLRMNAACAAGW